MSIALPGLGVRSGGAVLRRIFDGLGVGCGKESIEKTVDSKSRHRTKAGGNVFLDLKFPRKEANRLLAHADAHIDESIRLKQQLSNVVNHKVDKFATDAPVSMLPHIGKRVHLAVQ
jgi:hypothetical protein